MALTKIQMQKTKIIILVCLSIYVMIIYSYSTTLTVPTPQRREETHALSTSTSVLPKGQLYDIRALLDKLEQPDLSAIQTEIKQEETQGEQGETGPSLIDFNVEGDEKKEDTAPKEEVKKEVKMVSVQDVLQKLAEAEPQATEEETEEEEAEEQEEVQEAAEQDQEEEQEAKDDTPEPPEEEKSTQEEEGDVEAVEDDADEAKEDEEETREEAEEKEDEAEEVEEPKEEVEEKKEDEEEAKEEEAEAKDDKAEETETKKEADDSENKEEESKPAELPTEFLIDFGKVTEDGLVEVVDLKTKVSQWISMEIGNSNSIPMASLGEWKEGLMYDPTCELENRNDNSACCGEDVEEKHFEFDTESQLSNSEVVIAEFLSKVKGKNVLIIGDSIQVNLFMAWTEFFKLGKLNKNLKIIPRSVGIPKHVFQVC